MKYEAGYFPEEKNPVKAQLMDLVVVTTSIFLALLTGMFSL